MTGEAKQSLSQCLSIGKYTTQMDTHGRLSEGKNWRFY